MARCFYCNIRALYIYQLIYAYIKPIIAYIMHIYVYPPCHSLIFNIMHIFIYGVYIALYR